MGYHGGFWRWLLLQVREVSGGLVTFFLAGWHYQSARGKVCSCSQLPILPNSPCLDTSLASSMVKVATLQNKSRLKRNGQT